ncbi:TrbC/VirB2 family protein [Thalassospira lucentensis]|uniref:TrbC/VirB2 family protein n=1 Tax=Thalassospira lucentensis TaxID=168935 RepID=UPI002942C34C|nr:TrbC/VirB2 family protein [Thalassospira lucentensis]WOI09014.1 TrbC/VirB2 family protein [Thalassospira lucentensis]
MMRFFHRTLKIAERIADLPRWVHVVAVTQLFAHEALAQTTDVFAQMNELTTKTNTGLKGQVVAGMLGVSCLVLGAAYLVGQSNWAKQFQKQIFVGGVIIMIAANVATFFGLSSTTGGT